MTYCSIADMITRFNAQNALNELCFSEENPQGLIPNAFIIEAIKAASGEIDSALKARYVLPLNAIPQLLIDVCASIAFGLMHEWRKIGDKESSPFIAMAHARNILAQVEKGELALDASLLVGETAIELEAEITANPRLFSRKSMRGL